MIELSFCALVLRPALARVDDVTLAATIGNVHLFGDRHMPIPVVISLVGSAAAGVLSAVAGEGIASASAGAALFSPAGVAVALRPHRCAYQPHPQRGGRRPPDTGARSRPPTGLGAHHHPPRRLAGPGSGRTLRQPPQLTRPGPLRSSTRDAT